MSPERRHTYTVPVGNILIGGGNPVVIQSMTNTDTADINATVQQICDLHAAGSEIVRISVDRPASAKAVPHIVEHVRKQSDVPIVGDFHFQGHILLNQFPEMARALDKYRINPGNMGKGNGHDANFDKILEIAMRHNAPIRIGANGGSVHPKLLQKAMDRNAKKSVPDTDEKVLETVLRDSLLSSYSYARKQGMPPEQIILSAKVSDPLSLIRIHESIAARTQAPLHIGLTEAGGGDKGVIWSAMALSPLLQQGIGDTLRTSLTPRPTEPRTREVSVSQHILQSLGIRNFTPIITSCPGCGRVSPEKFEKITHDIQKMIDAKSHEWRQKYPKYISLKIAIMGCIVNGPGEARQADIGLFFPGKGEQDRVRVFQKGHQDISIGGEDISGQFLSIIEGFLSQNNE